jgi:hypothetical protein
MRDGFIGVELYTDHAPSEYESSASFALTGPTGNLRRNLEGQDTADSIQCMYPRGALHVKRMLDYRGALGVRHNNHYNLDGIGESWYLSRHGSPP